MVDLYATFAEEDSAEICVFLYLQKLAFVHLLLFFDVALILMVIIVLFDRVCFHILLLYFSHQMLYFLIIDLVRLHFDAIIEFLTQLGKLLMLFRFLVEI